MPNHSRRGHTPCHWPKLQARNRFNYHILFPTTAIIGYAKGVRFSLMFKRQYVCLQAHYRCTTSFIQPLLQPVTPKYVSQLTFSLKVKSLFVYKNTIGVPQPSSNLCHNWLRQRCPKLSAVDAQMAVWLFTVIK